jgi:hypothetical protein
MVLYMILERSRSLQNKFQGGTVLGKNDPHLLFKGTSRQSAGLAVENLFQT